MKNKWELLEESIGAWHEATFDTTEAYQWLKLNEEIDEYMASPNDHNREEELADVLFVLMALANRFDSQKARKLIDLILSFNKKEVQEKIYEEISKKFVVNKNRKWVKQINGTYHHIEADNE